ncbi:MAG: BolA family transcriptional regulator [Deltaproteobacteria bacterium HGW-Deltaproteobacteria-14]|nr:MAG: BolA family transcriptional regulator [Deltaproteobacteria bacterium HGW-Deltaproteobacteria-14]
MNENRLRDLLLHHFPDAEIALEDLTGTHDHWRARIVSGAFSGLSPVARHRLVYKALQQEMHGPIHALALDTVTPDEATLSHSQA